MSYELVPITVREALRFCERDLGHPSATSSQEPQMQGEQDRAQVDAVERLRELLAEAGQITQDDRVFAARWLGYGPDTCDRIRAGECDHLPGVRAAADFRHAALPTLLAERERLLSAFERYGQHDLDCTSRKGAHYGPEHCDCGFNTALTETPDAE